MGITDLSEIRECNSLSVKSIYNGLFYTFAQKYPRSKVRIQPKESVVALYKTFEDVST
jgi:hypothetical protein